MDLRPAGASDGPFLRLMLYEAATWRADPSARPPASEVLSDPHVALYVESWPLPRDAGFVASEDDRDVGAAWYRFLPPERPGYGFVGPSVPELTLAVAAGARRRGVGTALLAALLDHARTQGLAAISLSVEPDNPALRLYERAGFERVDAADGAWTMLARLDE